MAVPTVSSITPNTGLSGGRNLVKIVGTGFQLPPVPPATGRPPTSRYEPSVRVTFVGTLRSRVAPKVYVVSTEMLYVEVPALDPEFTTAAEDVAKPISVKVENVDQDGVLVGAETVTFAASYTPKRPDFASLANLETSNLLHVVRAFIQDLKRQVHKNVSLTVHVDYDSTTGDALSIVEDAQLPAIVLVGPTLRENRLHSENQFRTEDDGSASNIFNVLRQARTVDLEFDILGVSDSTMELLVMMDLLAQYFRRNIRLRVDRDRTASVAGEVEYEMDVLPGGDFSTADRANTSNLRQFGGRIVIRGVDLDEADMVFAKTKVLADYVQVGADSSVVTPSAVILGTDVDGAITVGQGGSDPSGGANDTPPALDFEQFIP